MNDDLRKKLREPFPTEEIGKLPKPVSRDDKDRFRCEKGTKASADGFFCGGFHSRSMHLDYVGHAAVTKRFLDVDPEWGWEPVAFGQDGLPVLDRNGGLWIRLTILGTTRLGYGDATGKQGANAVKEAIGDALRNAGMRFGVALDLWHKGDFADTDTEPAEPTPTVDWIAQANNAPTADTTLHVWQMARAQRVDQAILDQIAEIGQGRRAAEQQAAAAASGGA